MGAQTFLSIGAIALFMFTAVQVNKSFVAASAQVVSQQKEIALVNYGQTLADSLYSVAYDDLAFKEGTRIVLGTDSLVYELPEFIEYPAKITYLPPINMTWENTGTTLSPADYDGKYIPSLNISGGWTLNIDTGSEDRVLHVGDLNIQQGHVNIVGDGKITIIAENGLEFNDSSTFNSGGNQNKVFTYYGGVDELNFAGATNFNGSVYARDADIRIGGSGGIQGHIITGGDDVTINGAAEAISRALFAPNAHVSLTGSASVTGSIISNSFSAVGNARVYFSSDFDESLDELRLEHSGEGVPQYSIRSWY